MGEIISLAFGLVIGYVARPWIEARLAERREKRAQALGGVKPPGGGGGPGEPPP